MHCWKTIVAVLLINNLATDATEDLSNKLLCKGEMIRRAKIQSMYPDYEYEREGSERFYDPIQKKCLTKVDEPCPEVNATCAPNTECELRKSSVNVMLYRRCYCKEGLVTNTEKTYCGQVAGYGEDCSNVPPYVACDSSKGLSCHNKKCACRVPADMEYNTTAMTCKILADAECDSSNDCVEGAYCHGRCYCFHGVTKERHCYRGFLQECSVDKPCNDGKFLRCTDGFCKCKEPLHQLYEYNNCSVLVGGKCQTKRGEEYPGCVSNAKCVDGVCRCGGGFSATLDGVCRVSLKNQGSSCEPEECDFRKGLACVDGSCQCLDPALKYDVETKSCVASVGMKCGLVDEVGERRCEYKTKSGDTCLHYYISCDRGLPCLQMATTGESFCFEIQN